MPLTLGYCIGAALLVIAGVAWLLSRAPKKRQSVSDPYAEQWGQDGQ